jgi:hypothetical protein
MRARSVLATVMLLMLLPSDRVAADPSPDRLVSYDYLAKYGRPAGIYALSESRDDAVCPELLSLLNARFRLTGPEALPDHVYLLHTPRDVEWRDVKYRSLVGESYGFHVVVEQPASDPNRILLQRSMIGGYDVETLYLVDDKALRDGSDQQGLLTLDFVRGLEKDENGRHATVSSRDWAGNSKDLLLSFRFGDNYMTSVLLLDSGYYALITTPYAIDKRGYVRQGLAVLAFRLDWQSLKQPLCAFVH